MTYVRGLAIIGGLLNAVKTSGFVLCKVTLTSQSVGFCCTHITKTYIQNSWGGKIAAEHGVVKTKGSWVTVKGHSCQQKATEYSLST